MDAHPEWFCRDSAGRITGMYSRAFDVAHPGWQRYFIASVLSLVERLDIDGFRFDAPIYNNFHNWSARTRTNAAVSILGCLPLFAQLRTELRAMKPAALLYTEPSGVLLRQSMDLTYNYDEQWLIRAVLKRGDGNEHWVRNARDLGKWFAQRDASLPIGSMTAHYVDSHDSYWWPHPGQKWRREQYGAQATAALMTVFALSGGPLMTFVGGEIDIEEDVRAVHRVRARYPQFARGVSDYEGIDAGDDDIYAVVRRSSDGSGLLLVNLSDRQVTASCTLKPAAIGDDMSLSVTIDAIGGGSIGWSGRGDAWTTVLSLGRFQAMAIPFE